MCRTPVVPTQGAEPDTPAWAGLDLARQAAGTWAGSVWTRPKALPANAGQNTCGGISRAAGRGSPCGVVERMIVYTIHPRLRMFPAAQRVG